VSARTTTIRGIVATVEHAATSRNNNPTYRVTLDDGRTFLTETDGSVGYGATNFRPDRQGEPFVTTLTIGARGRIVRMVKEFAETWLLFDHPGDEEASHEANIEPTTYGFRASWSHNAVGLVSSQMFDTREEALAYLAAGGYENYTA
jgi:hypothetical protein